MSRLRRRLPKPHPCHNKHESIWQHIRCGWHEHTPYIGIRLDDFLP